MAGEISFFADNTLFRGRFAREVCPRGLSARSFYDAASPPSRLSLLMRCLVSMLARQSLASLQHSHIATTCINRAGARELPALLVLNGALRNRLDNLRDSRILSFLRKPYGVYGEERRLEPHRPSGA